MARDQEEIQCIVQAKVAIEAFRASSLQEARRSNSTTAYTNNSSWKREFFGKLLDLASGPNQKRRIPIPGTGPLYNKIGQLASGERFFKRKPWQCTTERRQKGW